MAYKLLKGGHIINRGKTEVKDILIKDDRIEKIDSSISHAGADEYNVEGKLVVPGVIDDQVHFREPGLTYKADIASESRAAVAGGTTTFMEMPNTKPAAITQKLLQDKYDIAAQSSYANYSFFMGAANDNLEEVLKTDPKSVCGVKIFMGSSTGNMLVDNRSTLESLFSNVEMIIATHCEDEQTIRDNMEKYKAQFGDALTAKYHPIIRDVEGCYLSSSQAVEMAKKFGTRLHILHISTAKELDLFRNDIPLREKKITSEVCVHHLHFTADDYDRLGNKIKCNPAIKASENRDALWPALLDDRLDIIATDHAPHTMEEKSNPYMSAPSGLPLVQHSLVMMMDAAAQGKISKEKVIEKMCHAPADLFDVKDRGYLDEGKYADIVVLHPDKPWQVAKENILFKCGWSPLEGHTFKHQVQKTFVNGDLVYVGTHHIKQGAGMRVTFDR